MLALFTSTALQQSLAGPVASTLDRWPGACAVSGRNTTHLRMTTCELPHHLCALDHGCALAADSVLGAEALYHAHVSTCSLLLSFWYSAALLPFAVVCTVCGHGAGRGGAAHPAKLTVTSCCRNAKAALLCQSQVFALAADTVLDGEALARILRMGHSRVPVHTPGDRTDLLGVVLVKELVLLDPDDRVRRHANPEFWGKHLNPKTLLVSSRSWCCWTPTTGCGSL